MGSPEAIPYTNTEVNSGLTTLTLRIYKSIIVLGHVVLSSINENRLHARLEHAIVAKLYKSVVENINSHYYYYYAKALLRLCGYRSKML